MRVPFKITTKSYMIAFLLVLSAVSSYAITGYYFLLQSVVSAAIAAVIDLAIFYAKERKTFLPSSAIISGLFIGMILPLARAELILLACLLAILSKHAIKVKGRHVFNPAAFGLVISLAVFGLSTAWWGASSLLVPLGLFIVYKQRKWLLVLPFVAVYYALSFAASGTLALLDTTLFFFAFFMLLEPMTSAYAKRAMIAQGVLVAALAVIVKIFLPAFDIFLLPLLVSNIFVGALNKKLK